jgi:subtilase family protein/Big-like domain-containing protein/fervidolysin-like protein
MLIRFGAALALIVGSLSVVPGVALAVPPSAPGMHVPGELLVAPQDGVSDQELLQVHRGLGATLVTIIPGIRVHHIRVAPQGLDGVEAALQHHPKVKFVERNFLGKGGLVPNDPGFAYQWHLPKISAPSGWDLTTGSTSVPIAIIDSGVDPTHPDLAGKLLPGFNFLNNTTDTHDVLGHGTAVAGTAAAATNDDLGIAGVAWANPIMPLVVLDSTDYASYANIASAITYATDHGAKVINISIGGSSYSSTLQSAVNYAWSHNLVIVACAMNYATSAPYYPAALSNVVAVSATDQSDNLASFSDYGTWIALSAPGTSIYTTTNGGGYGYWYGTSFASPQAAALAALAFSMNPALTNSQVVSLMESNADDLGLSGYDQYFGWGRIDVAKTLQSAQNTLAITSTPLTVTLTAPTNGSAVSGTVNVTASVTDQVTVSKVELYVNGAYTATALASPWSFAWNTMGLSGSQSLVATAYDVSGKSASSAPATVSIASTAMSSPSAPASLDTTPPSVTISGMVSNGKFVTVSVSASDPDGAVVRVELYLDGALYATDGAQPWTFKLNTKPWVPGTHTLTAKGYDATGNVGTSTPVTLTK